MARWHILTETGLFVLIALLVVSAAGLTLPLFRTLVVLALLAIAAGVVWRLQPR